MKVYKMLGVQSMEYLSLVGLIVVIFKITEGDVFVYVFHSPCLHKNQISRLNKIIKQLDSNLEAALAS